MTEWRRSFTEVKTVSNPSLAHQKRRLGNAVSTYSLVQKKNLNKKINLQMNKKIYFISVHCTVHQIICVDCCVIYNIQRMK